MKKNLFNLKIATLAAGMLFSTAISAQFTAVTSGNWSSGATWGGTAPSPTVSNQNITIPSGITVDMDQDVTFSGLLNTFMVNGVLTNTTSNWILMTSGSLSGTGTVSISKLRLTSLSTLTFGGTLNLKSMSNSVASLAFASIANITDTLELENGNLSLNTNGNLTMMTGSTIKVGGGTMAINSGVFNSSNAYNIMYVGINKTSGVEFNSTAIQHVYLNMNDNTQSVKLGSNATVNGTIYLQKGMLDLNGKKATLKGDLMITSGAMFQSNGTSDMEIQGTGTLSSTLMFNSGSSMHDLTINRTATGQVKLGNALSIGGNLNLMEGTMSVENGGNLAASSNSTIHIEKGMLSLNSGTLNIKVFCSLIANAFNSHK